VIVCNLTPVLRTDYRIGVPYEGYYQEIFNSDAKEYGGAGNGNLGGKIAERVPCHGRDFSIGCTLPSLSSIYFKWKGNKKAEGNSPHRC
jgi:1,4-alpha-glucan branching enzyme